MISRLPAPEGGAGGTVFWDTGAVLFKYGKNKQQAVDFFTALSTDERIWQNSVVGDPDAGNPAGRSTAGLAVAMDDVEGQSTRVDYGQSVDLGDLRQSRRRQRNRPDDPRRQAVRHGAAGMAQVPHRRGAGRQDGGDQRDERGACRVQAADRKGRAVAFSQAISAFLSPSFPSEFAANSVGREGEGNSEAGQRRGKGGA